MARANTINAYIWDLDGTLFDSYGAIVASLAELAAECGAADQNTEILKAVKQGSVSGYLRELSARTAAEYDFLYRRYREIIHIRMDEITLIPGAANTLKALTDAGARHFVYTHRGQSTWQLLDRLGLTPFFDEIVTFEKGFKPKPSGEGIEYLVKAHRLMKDLTAYIGDRTLDIYSAKDAGVLAILYLPEGTCVRPTGVEDRIIRKLEELAE